MDISKELVERTMRETWDSVRGQVERGTTAVRDSIGRLPYLASVSASVQHDDIERDETHYFLVPTPFAPSGCALYSIRRLPEGVGGDNDLPRLRVLHLASESHAQVLIDLVLDEESRAEPQAFDEDGASESTEPSEPAPEDRSIADRLQDVADEIDRHERKVTGGILLIGGVVATGNPVLGVGILSQAILPSLGALVTREGLKLAGDKLRGWTRDRDQRQQEREREAQAEAALAEFHSTPVTSFINPVLRDLLKALRTDGSEFDPCLDIDLGAVEVEGWNRQELVRLTARAVAETYGDASGTCVAEGFDFGDEDRRWLEVLRGLADTRQEASPGTSG